MAGRSAASHPRRAEHRRLDSSPGVDDVLQLYANRAGNHRCLRDQSISPKVSTSGRRRTVAACPNRGGNAPGDLHVVDAGTGFLGLARYSGEWIRGTLEYRTLACMAWEPVRSTSYGVLRRPRAPCSSSRWLGRRSSLANGERQERGTGCGRRLGTIPTTWHLLQPRPGALDY